MKDELVKTQIRSREVIYYLASDNDLNEIKKKGIFADIFTLLFSLSAGGIISIFIAMSITESVPYETLSAFRVLNIVFIIAAVVFLTVAIYFYKLSYNTISQIKGSGKIKSYSAQEESNKNEFQILQAIYWTKNAKLDVTEKLIGMTEENKLEVVASNKIYRDPDVGTRKKLTIKYRYNGIELIREYNEREKIILP